MNESELKEAVRHILYILRKEEEQPLDWRALRNALEKHGVYDVYDDVVDRVAAWAERKRWGPPPRKRDIAAFERVLIALYDLDLIGIGELKRLTGKFSGEP